MTVAMAGPLNLATFGALTLAAVMATAFPAYTQDLSLNPDNLSFFEEPLAFEVLGFTLTYNQLVDQPVSYDFEKYEDEYNPRIDFQTSIERQLPNALTVGATYYGSFERERDSEYEDRWGVFVRGVWGRLALGEVDDTVRVATRRMWGTGNARLEFDDAMGDLDDDFSAAYSLRISAYTLNLAIDTEAQTDIGITYDRPGRWFDYRFTARYTRGQVDSVYGSAEFDTHAAILVAEMTYGSFVGDVGFGYERLDGVDVGGNRFFFSTGLHYKVRRLTLSTEGHYGAIEGDPEASVAVGARYDIARGFSVNLGYNFATSDARIAGVPIRKTHISEVRSSLRYEF